MRQFPCHTLVCNEFKAIKLKKEFYDIENEKNDRKLIFNYVDDE